MKHRERGLASRLDTSASIVAEWGEHPSADGALPSRMGSSPALPPLLGCEVYT